MKDVLCCMPLLKKNLKKTRESYGTTFFFKPLLPDISIHVLHTVLGTFVRCWQGEFV